ncbi:MAG TPA: helicase C-terminal domain-containing protein [Candidatus Acidoferrales bacterium]|nr:helicase C-terminal domain-containing protein [Candidatus Acidoferrales bacterium]
MPERRYVPDPYSDDPARSLEEELSVTFVSATASEPAAIDESSGPTIHDIFGPRGMLQQCMPRGYEHRPSQLEMAALIEKAFATKQHAIVEAGTGTGKTLAYLIPAIRSGKRIVISTATKSLQEQLFNKDIPFLQKHFAPDLKVAVMKGRGNFLCRQKVYSMEGQPVLKGFDEVDWFTQISTWEKLTETGDRAELSFLPDDAELWHRLDARREMCTGQKCPEFNRCFVTWMHQRAATADIVIVNHHLFFADLALRQDDFASILPEYDAVIFDEAHEIEDVSGDYFGRQISNYRFEELARDTEQALRGLREGTASLLKRAVRVRERSRTFFEGFPPREGRSPFERSEREAFLDRNREPYNGLLDALKALETEIGAIPAKPDELANIARRSFELRGETSFLFESDESNYVYWMERRNKGIFLTATPIDVSNILREHLFERFETVVLTSATLAVGGRFDYLKKRLGVPAAIERVLPTEFDYPSQAMLYIPAHMPDVRDAGFITQAAHEITKLLETTEGRAFCLFTSYSQMNELFGRVREKVDFPLLLQGTAPRAALLEKFRNTPNAVLFATSSFWQGVDVPGAQLSCVIVDKLPFAVPSDPIVAARVRALTEAGRNAFAEFQVPEAVLALKQGFGRLIRTRSDRGVLAILDNRIQRMQYGKIFLASLPDYSITRDLAEVARFMLSDS